MREFDPITLYQHEKESFQSALSSASLLRKRGSPEESAQFLVPLIAHLISKIGMSDSPELKRILCQAYYARGVALADICSKNELLPISQFYEAGIKIAKEIDDSDLLQIGLFHLGNLFRLVGDYKVAEKILLEGIYLGEFNARGHLLLARLYSLTGYRDGFDEAINSSIIALAEDSQKNSHFNIGSLTEVQARGYLIFDEIDKAMQLLSNTNLSTIETIEPWKAILDITYIQALLRYNPKVSLEEYVFFTNSTLLKLKLTRQRARLANVLGLSINEIERLTLKGNSISLRNTVYQFSKIKPGKSDAKRYEELVAATLETLLHPPLGRINKDTSNSTNTSILDASASNALNLWPWSLFKEKYDCISVLFEMKNKTKIRTVDVYQLSSYLDQYKGRFGILVTRNPPGNREWNLCTSQLQRKDICILIISDQDIFRMVRYKSSGRNPSAIIFERYSELCERI